MPEISVIIPIYKAENDLKRCLNGFLSQTFKDFEIILIDDGSPDSCGKICDEYALKDARIFVLHKKNGGVSSARNGGLKAVRGKYVAFVDGDDCVDKDYLKKLLEGIKSYRVDFCMCRYVNVFAGANESESKHEFPLNKALDKEKIKTCVFDTVFKVGLTDGLFSPWGKLFKKDIIYDFALKMDEKMSFGEDMLFVISYFENCSSAVFISDALYYYERRDDGLFNKYRSSLIDDILKCFITLKQKTAPPCAKDLDFLPLTLKYHYYLIRFIRLGVKAEKNKFRFVKNVLNRKEAVEIFDRIARNREILTRERGWSEYELRVAKLISRGHKNIAARYLIYQNDESNIFRKIKKFFKK